MKDLERELAAYLKERKWDKLRPSDVAKSIVIEAAELLELFQWVDLTIAETKKDKDRLKKLESELADVIIYCLEMSVILGLDTKKIVRAKLEHAREKYPAELMRKAVHRKNPLSDKTYWEIKEEYRKEKK